MAKSAAEKQREYRERKRLGIRFQPKLKSSTERSRETRERRRQVSSCEPTSSCQQSELQHPVEVFVKEEDLSEEITDGNFAVSDEWENNPPCSSSGPIERIKIEQEQQGRERFSLKDFKFVDVQTIINSSNITTSVRVKTSSLDDSASSLSPSPKDESINVAEINGVSDLCEVTLKKLKLLTSSEKVFAANQNSCDERGLSLPESSDFGKRTITSLGARPCPDEKAIVSACVSNVRRSASVEGENVGLLDCSFSAYVSEPQAQQGLEILQDSVVSSSDCRPVDDLVQISKTVVPLREEEYPEASKETVVPLCPRDDLTVTHLTDTLFVCYICETTFTSLSTLRRHKRVHSQETHICEDCGTSFYKLSAFLVHQRRHAQGKVNKCSVCHKSFVSSGSLAAHKRVHSGEKPFVCECGAAFSWGVSLKQHKFSHTCDRLYSCDKCGSCFPELSSLRTHKTSHVSEHCSAALCQKSDLKMLSYPHMCKKPYPCRLCGKAFSKTGSRNAQKRSHSVERPHVCEMCGATFTQASSLTRHKVFHTNLKPYSCDECDAAFSLSGNLKRHKVIHTAPATQWLCGECDITFAFASDLKQHKKTHLAKSHMCDVCQVVFSRAGNLRLHKLTHTGEKTYHCDECEAMFSQLSAWRTHKLTHSSGST